MTAAQPQSTESVRHTATTTATDIDQPLADLHVHIEGAIPLNEMIVLWLRKGLTPPSHHAKALVQRSLEAVHELAAEFAGWWRRSSPYPGLGVGVELAGGDLHGVDDLGGVCKGLSGQRRPA
jgi:hypothetical protein